MKKDIEIPEVKDVYVAAVNEYNETYLSQDWTAYIINNTNTLIEMVIVVSKGYDGNKETSTMRHGIGIVPAKSFKKIEFLPEDLLKLTNEFSVSYFAENKLHQKKFIFNKGAIKLKDVKKIPIINNKGILAK
ncbi:hypothetical protein ACG2LH_02195 [Zhouia sp. PK063]|uniref:hypothetical protein n=1 Tax=Zhouia sp. PK063 TaxID=3373602 RepID=UPI0037A76C01